MAKAQAVAAAATSVVLGCLALTSCGASAPSASATVNATPQSETAAPAHQATAPAPASAATPTADGLTTFVMPSGVGVDLQGVLDKLEAINSYILDVEDASGQGRIPVTYRNWKVCTQDPAPGAVVPVSALVTVAVVKLTESC